MSVNVTIRLKAIGNSRRREHHRDRDGDKIIDRGRVQSLDERRRKGARRASLFFYAPLFFRLCIERETHRACLSSREERRTRRIDRAFYWPADLVLWKRHNFLHPTSDVAHTLALLYARKNVRRARSEFATQSDFTLYKHPISPLRIMRYNIPCTLPFRFFDNPVHVLKLYPDIIKCATNLERP